MIVSPLLIDVLSSTDHVKDKSMFSPCATVPFVVNVAAVTVCATSAADAVRGLKTLEKTDKKRVKIANTEKNLFDEGVKDRFFI